MDKSIDTDEILSRHGSSEKASVLADGNPLKRAIKETVSKDADPMANEKLTDAVVSPAEDGSSKTCPENLKSARSEISEGEGEKLRSQRSPR